jgi:polyadenylate-binding protein
MATQVAQGTNSNAGANVNAGTGSGNASGNTSQQFASLYVGDLAPEVSEDVLYQTFNAIGPVASIRVCRDSVTRRSLGYAYVNFHAVADAERALETLNFSNIKGKPCRIMWSHRDPASRKATGANVFVKNLDKAIDNKALHDTFSLFGNILSCKVAQDPDGKSRGFGFVHFETEEAAKAAIEKLNGMKIGEKQVFVGNFQKHAEREDGTPKQFTNVYLKHIPASWTEEFVRDKLNEFGVVTSYVLKTDPKGRRFAFANYEEFDQAQKCVDTLHGVDQRTPEEKAAKLTEEELELLEEEKEDDIYTYQLYCTRAQNKSERQAELKAKFQTSTSSTPNGTAAPVAPGGNNLYIKNLGETIGDEELKEMFEPFGAITSCKVMRDDKGESRCFGFVCYVNPEDATKAVTEMHLKLIGGKPLYVGLHEKKEQRIERLQNRFRLGATVPGAPQPGGMMMRPGGPAPGMPYGFPNRGPAGPRPMGQPGMPGSFPPRQQMPGYMMGAGRMPGMPMMAGGPKGMMPGGAPQMRQPGMMPQGGVPMRQPGMGGVPQRFPGQFPMGGATMQRPAPQMDLAPFDPNGPLTAAALAAAPPAMQKQMLGEKLFPAIHRIQPELAGKITGMMLEMDNSELLILLESEHQLRFKVDEALRVLQG